MNEWRTRAACRNKDPELFFPVARGVGRTQQVAEAREVCRRCPVAEQCLRDAVDNGETFGVRAGYDLEDNNDRRVAWESRGKAANRYCGTPYGYKLHRNRDETACDSCKAANSKRDADYRARVKNGQHTVRTGRPAKPIEHGTPAGDRAHRRRGEKPCRACLDAHNRYQKDKRPRTDHIHGNTVRVRDAVIRYATTDARELATHLHLEPYKVTRCLRSLRDKGLLDDQAVAS